MIAQPRKLSELLPHLRERVEKTPNDVALLQKLGRLYVKQGNVQEAIDMFRRVIKIAPDQVNTYLEIALACLTAHLFDEARFAIEQAQALQPGLPAVFLAFSKLEEALGNREGQISFLMLAANAAPDKPHIRISLAELLRKLGDHQEARRQYELVLADHPRQEIPHFALGVMDMRKGKIEQAIDHFQAILRFNPSAHDARFNLAQCLIREHRWAQAIPHLQAAARGLPNSHTMIRLLAECHANLKQWDQALVLLEREGNARPDDLALQKTLGDWYVLAGEPDMAEEVFRRLTELAPERPESFVCHAEVLLQRGRHDAARETLAALFRLHPGHIDGHRLLGEVWLDARQFSEAADEFRNTLLVNDRYLPGYLGLANVHRALGQDEQEFQILKQAAAMAGPLPVAMEFRLAQLERAFDLTSSLKRFRRIQETSPDSHAGIQSRYFLRHLDPAKPQTKAA